MTNQNAQFVSAYHGFEDDYKAEILKVQLVFSKIKLEYAKYMHVISLRNMLQSFE